MVNLIIFLGQPQQPPRVYIPNSTETRSIPVFRTTDVPPSPVISYDQPPAYIESNNTHSELISDNTIGPDPATDNSQSSLFPVAV